MLITCLGLSGSGKTVFLGTLLDCLHSPVNAQGGFYILDRRVEKASMMDDTLNHKSISILANLEAIRSDGFNGYPASTSGTVTREFSLMHGKEIVLDISWLDYKGGLINSEVKDKGSRNTLYDNLNRSTAVVIFLDAYQIATSTSISQARRRVGIDSITKILSHFEVSKENKSVNILIILTQCDAVADEKWLGSGNYAPLKQYTHEVLGGLWDMVYRNAKWKCGMVAVTAVGIGCNRRTIIQEATFNRLAQTRDEIIDEPAPENIVEAFYWLVACEVATQKEGILKRISKLSQYKERVAGGLAEGIDEVCKQVLFEEQQRIDNLGFLKRLKEKIFLEENKRSRGLTVEQQRRSAEYQKQVLEVLDKIDKDIFSAQENLLNFEKALQPLFDRANTVVHRVA